MAAAKTDKTKEKKQTFVRCQDCVFFKRDTEGISRNAYTGEYFMGICTLGLTPDSPKKQFADKLRVCSKYSNNLKQLRNEQN